jgi:hypothetical protein
MFTAYPTMTLDDLSSYFLCSNDSNGKRIGRKLNRGMGMRGNSVLENGGCGVRLSRGGSEGSEVKAPP